MKRRDFLLGGAALLAGATLPLGDRLARAIAPAGGRNLLIVLAAGGWDVTWALDPKPGVPTVDAPSGEVRRFGESPILIDPSRPAIEAFFERHGPLTAVVSGVQVRSVAHPTCRRRILTGSASTEAPDVGAAVAHALGRELPLPYLVLGDTAFPGPLAASSGRVGTTNQLQALLDPQADFSDGSTGSRFVPDAADEDLVRRWLEARSERALATRAQRGANRDRVIDYLESLERGEALKAHAGAFGERGITLGLEQQIGVALDAIAGDVAHSVLLDTRFPWDSHANNAVQGVLHELLFAGLGTLVDELVARPGRASGARMIDETVVLVVSEMSRTPRFNVTAGKDHWPFTSAMVIGGGVAGGRTYGGTDDRLEGQQIDLATGAVEPGGVSLLAENLVAGVLELVGVEPSIWLHGVQPLRALHA